MLAGAGWAWTEIGKTLNSLGFGSGGFDFDFSNYNFPAVDNKVEQAKKELEDSIAAAQGADPMAEVQGSTTLGVANTGSARNPDGTPANPGVNTPSAPPPIAEVPVKKESVNVITFAPAPDAIAVVLCSVLLWNDAV